MLTANYKVPYRVKLMDHLFNTKVWFLFLISMPSFFWPFVNKYISSDIGYVKWLGIAMVIDLVTGITAVWKKDGYSAIKSRGIRDTVHKAISYGAFLIITHIITHFEVNGQQVNSTFTWVDKMACEFLMIIEGKSIYENITSISPSLDVFKLMVEKIGELVKKKG